MKNKVENMKAGRVQLSTLKPGDVFKIGAHDFIVLEQKQGHTKVISKGFMAGTMKFDEDSRDYNNSALKMRIERDIQPVIERAVGSENIIENEVCLTSVDMQNEFGTCKCKVRPITFDEARKYNDLLPNEELGDWWWTCTPWSTEQRGFKYSIAVVSSSGYVNYNFCYDCSGVRPFCIIKSNIFVSPSTQNKIGIKRLGVGESFELAGITWKILDISDRGYMCLADKLDETMEFDSKSSDWKLSELREFLNEDFYKALAENIGENNIIPFHRDLLSLDGQTDYGTCEDKVSLLTVDEYRKYRGLIPNTGNYWWWTCTPWSTPCNDYKTSATVVSSSGFIYGSSCCNCGGVRPVCIFASAVFESEE